MTEPVQDQLRDSVQASFQPGRPGALSRLAHPGGLRRGAGCAASKVPEVSVYFWITKVLTTGMGETTSDFLVTWLGPLIAVALGAAGLAITLLLQFAVRRYVPWIYWSAVVMVSVFGTMAADVLHVGLDVPYAASTVVFTVVLAVVFIVWHRTERTLSIHSILTPRREFFYWAAVLTTFALGTAAGDLTAMTLNLGYLPSAVLFAVIIAIPAVDYRRLGLNAVVGFWFAYITARPLGASLADWMAVSPARGGLDWGSGPVSLGWAALILGFVSYLAITGRDIERKGPRPAPDE
ncbi:hypothetical protein FCN77_00450 [Arthrobacter sp. 24S4-2]|uniref:COG4705 family protein n=1 Tax=Arthrobacter sp. 24S4-2 TaxID=2575374 RepID=UPI0010C777DC|nr:hypothetical protein [Arthrobacter sp. 24S4-2]QCO96462.1 hypothetical protein FCN77_00450 [Arthrobacter sp. 24S4-2]